MFYWKLNPYTIVLIFCCFLKYARFQYNDSNNETLHYKGAVKTSHGIAYCAPYCDSSEMWRSGFYCIRPIRVYCCGNSTQKYCCSDYSSRVTNEDNEPVEWCKFMPWWYNNWRVMIGMLAAVLILTFVCGFFYYCCSGGGMCFKQRQYFRRRRRSDERSSNVAAASSSEAGRRDVSPPPFNPDSPNAFLPPAYDNLPKEPPKYSELFGESASSEINNAAVSGFTTNSAANNAPCSNSTSLTNETATVVNLTGNNATCLSLSAEVGESSGYQTSSNSSRFSRGQENLSYENNEVIQINSNVNQNANLTEPVATTSNTPSPAQLNAGSSIVVAPADSNAQLAFKEDHPSELSVPTDSSNDSSLTETSSTNPQNGSRINSHVNNTTPTERVDNKNVKRFTKQGSSKQTDNKDSCA